MLNEVITQPATRRAEKLETRLVSLGGRSNKRRYESMDLDDLRAHVRVIENRLSARRKSLMFGDESRDREYATAVTELGVASAVLEARIEDADARALVHGMTYYRSVKDGSVLTGERCTYLEGRAAAWSKFSMPRAVAKAVEVMRHGGDDDFRRIRYLMADGGGFSDGHLKAIAESTPGALAKIEEYCDERWEGAWPWQAEAPSKLRTIMAEEARNRMDRLAKERKAFDLFVAALNESDVDKSEVIIDGREIADKIADMIESLGRISAEIMTSFKDKLRTHFGPEASNALNQIFNDKVSTAVDSLSDLRDAVGNKLDQLESGGGIGGMGGTDMGMGTDPMGGAPGGIDSGVPTDPHAAAAGLGDEGGDDMGGDDASHTDGEAGELPELGDDDDEAGEREKK